MWTALAIAASFLAAAAAWHVFEHFWNRRLFHRTSHTDFSINIRAPEAQSLLENHPDVLPIDVRPPQSFAKRHLPNALNAPFVDSQLDTTTLASIHRSTPILIYCDGGYRSRKALPHFRNLGFRSIYHLHRGILSWNLRRTSSASQNSKSA